MFVIQDKIRATSIHFVFSLILAVVCFCLVYMIWYPYPLFKATGVQDLFFMMLAIDLILGPLLTFIVYKKLKKTLKFDLSIIVLIQIIAMLYGVFSMYQGRPVWIAFAGDRFEVVKANDVIYSKNNEPNLPKWGPEFTYVSLQADSANKQLNMMLEEIQNGISPIQKLENQTDLVKNFNKVNKKLKNVDELFDFNAKDSVDQILGQNPEANAWIPLSANQKDMVVLFNDKNIIKIVDLRPWN